MRRWLPGVAAGLLLAMSAATAGPQPTPLCQVSLTLEPGQAYAGQAVLYRLRILRRADVDRLDWERAPFFPDLRAEWLPGRAADDPVRSGGSTYLVFEERRALFPTHGGPHRIPAASLRCRTSGGATEITPIPPLVLDAREPPQADRPQDWNGVIGPVDVAVQVEPRRVRLGESLRVSVRIEGDGNVWAARAPFAAEHAIPGAEIFPEPPTLARDCGKRLRLRRYFRVQVVPRRTGFLTIPEVRVPYFDPGAGRYGVARATAVRVEVIAPLEESSAR